MMLVSTIEMSVCLSTF